jgi:tetratricopeptide (TPR) repeat protein
LPARGTVSIGLDRWPEAADAFDRALRLAPDDEAALRARAVAREERGLHSGAAADYERLAFVLDVASRSAEAADAARHAANLEPSATRAALADRLAVAAAQVADSHPRTPGTGWILATPDEPADAAPDAARDA